MTGSIDAAIDRQLLRQLERAAPGAVAIDVELSSLSRWQIGGTAHAVVEPGSAREVAQVMEIMSARSEPFGIVGDTSNLLFDSGGFGGVLLRVGRRMASMRITGSQVWAQAGISVPTLARRVGEAGLTGVEHTVGIPGTLGGLVLMNGGSQRKGIGNNVASVVCATRDGEIVELSRDQCEFDYRTSSLQGLGAAVIETTLTLDWRDPLEIQLEMDEILASRAARFPSDLPSCGSTFLSDPAMYETFGSPGHAIEAAGLKGWRRGDAQISEQHANFFVNVGRASSDDMLFLVALARNTVRELTGFTMDCEVRHVARDGRIRPAHEVAIERWGEALTRESILA